MKLNKDRLAGSNVQYTRYPFDMFAKVQRELGISRIDLSGTTPHLWCDHLSPADTWQVAETLKETGLSVAAFTPRAYRYSLCAEEGSLQGRGTLDYYRNCIEAASSLGCGLLVVNAEGGCFDRPKQDLLANCRRMLKELTRIGEGYGVSIAVAPAHEEDTPVLTSLAEIAETISEAGEGMLGAALDVHLASLRGETIKEWFDMLGDRIRLVRFTDGNYNGTRVWGKGCLPCEGFLTELSETGYGGTLSLHMAGEKYIEDPAAADRENVMALARFFQ